MSAACPVIGTYPRPKHGWTCFHCGETFHTVGAARDHFGHDPMAEPGCRIKVGEELGLLIELRKSQKDFADLIDRMHKLDSEAEAAHETARDVLRAAKATNAHEVRCNLDSLEGRALAAEATVRAIEATHPELVARAREAICRPVFKSTGRSS